MTKQELKEKLVGKNLFFINQLVKQLGGSKKGSKSQDIEEILAFYDQDADKVVSAFETKVETNKNRFSKIKNAFHEIRNHWEEIVIFVAESPNVPDGVQKAVEVLDSIIDGIFPIKHQFMIIYMSTTINVMPNYMKMSINAHMENNPNNYKVKHLGLISYIVYNQ